MPIQLSNNAYSSVTKRRYEFHVWSKLRAAQIERHYSHFVLAHMSAFSKPNLDNCKHIAVQFLKVKV